MVAVAALPPHSSAGRRCHSGGAGAEVAVLCRGCWLQCSFGQPFHPILVGGSPTLGASVAGFVLTTRHLSGFPWGPSDTGHG